MKFKLDSIFFTKLGEQWKIQNPKLKDHEKRDRRYIPSNTKRIKIRLYCLEGRDCKMARRSKVCIYDRGTGDGGNSD